MSADAGQHEFCAITPVWQTHCKNPNTAPGHPKCIRNTWKGPWTCENWGCSYQLLTLNQQKSAQTVKALNGQP